ncbi:MAG: hypothetical protein KF903_08410 [Dokdonella sp.]|uniref:hypothetical protein n=1 Tax=Dokdonella sp. TaxID=2291710 RepID=UPI0025BDB6B4|nr:hypothetical protein [Dokdonella sp.]MBX3701003.1 hypothetical protein [Dokdonella sp.]
MRTRLRQLAFLLFAPFAVLLAVEAAFHSGLYERWAQPSSHAGTSVRLKQALLMPLARHIDFVTLGSSRPQFGLDHAAWRQRAAQHGYVHANLTMPGTHWMTIEVLRRWLVRTHPEVRGAVIAMSIQDFNNPGNGSYELGIVQPFRELADTAWIANHVAFDAHDAATWGVYSAMAQWRSDLRAFLANPKQRLDSIAWFITNMTPERILFENAAPHADACRHGIASLDACAALEQATDETGRALARQCRELQAMATYRPNYVAMLRGAAVPEPVSRARAMVRAQLGASTWPQPTVVLLMPAPSVWQREVLGNGLHAWALDVLQPLVDEGRIHVLDATDLLADGADECANYFDFYHQSSQGRAKLDAWLEPRLAPLLYGAPSTGR